MLYKETIKYSLSSKLKYKRELAQNLRKISDKENQVESPKGVPRQAATRLQSDKELSGKDRRLTSLIKQIIEVSLEGELFSNYQ